MGCYKDYNRGSKRADPGGESESPAFRSRSDRDTTGRSVVPDPVEAIVKWFNSEKGFGFVGIIGGSEAFVHIQQVEAAGHRTLDEGARVKVRIRAGQKGFEVAEITEVLAGTVAVRVSTEARSHAPSQVTGKVVESFGTVSLYRADKGFGFVAQDSGGKDVFVHSTALARAGLGALVEGQRVRMQVGQGQEGLEAQAIELLEG